MMQEHIIVVRKNASKDNAIIKAERSEEDLC